MARALIEARTRAGLTQAELAARMKTTQSAAARLESGRTPPSTRTLEKVARATGTRLRIQTRSTASSKLSLERPNGRSRHPTRRWAAGPRSRRRNLWFSQVGQRQRCSPAPPIGYATGAPPVARPGRAAVWPLSADRQPGGRRPRSSPCRSVACVGAACGCADSWSPPLRLGGRQGGSASRSAAGGATPAPWKLVTVGKTPREIAAELGVTTRTA